MTSDVRANHFKKSAIPVALIAALVVASQLGIEFTLPADGPERADELASGPAWTIRLVGAAILSISSLLLVRGVHQDRALIQARDDRLAGEYLAAGALTAIVSTFTGAVPGIVIGAGVIAAIGLLRRDAADPRGAAARDARNAALLVLAASLLLLGVREIYATYLQWADGYGISSKQIATYTEDNGGHLVIGAALVLAVLVALLLPLAAWRHRASLRDVRGLYLFASFGVAVLSLISRNWPGVAIGLVCLVLTLILASAKTKESH